MYKSYYYCFLRSSFGDECIERVIALIKPYSIRYKETETSLMFTLYDNMDGFETLYQALADIYVLDDGETAGILKDWVYTKDEIERAEWLTMYTQYSRVESIKDTTFSYTHPYAVNHAYGCEIVHYSHRDQVGPFILSTAYKWPARCFFVSYLGSFTDLFTNAAGKDFLASYCPEAIGFKGVYLKRVDGLQDSNIFQLDFQNVLPTEEIVPPDVPVKKCEVCGRWSYEIHPALYQMQVYSSYLNAKKKIYRTEKIFGPGFPDHKIVIHQSMRQEIIRRNMQKNLVFAPLITVKN